MQSNYLPPLEPIGDFRSYVCGDVVIDQTAAIAAGVLIQADQGGRITIAAGACIGMGAVLHAQGGVLEIGAGANLGAGVLVYGSSKIGDGACIGASSSIVRAVIAKGAIVPPCSLISGLEQSALEKEANPAIVQELAVPQHDYPSESNYSFTHADPPAQPLTNNFNAVTELSNNPDNIIERATTETYVHTSVTATPDLVTANSIERTVTETQVEIPVDQFAEAQSETANAIANESVQPMLSSPIGDADIANTDIANTDIANIVTANSAQAKAYAQSQINRYIKRLYPQN